ncbi:HNH endonuclease [Chryseobacterium paludis]|uniref:HNH endonuclease n=1 Tax=Chryseobacterium paludis TaxID=2956784 RepID=UPI0021BFA500|nr:HNH endonuclease [Chryseobacterium paludis]
MSKEETSKNNRNYWVFKTIVENTDRSFQTIDSYGDKLEEYYNYDSLVPNSKQIKAGDVAIMTDKKKILGFVIIDHVNSQSGTKIVRRCPVCPSTTIDARKIRLPKYRCNKGHEFERPVEEIRNVEKYTAIFNTFIPCRTQDNSLKQLRPFYISGYNQNMSMQRLAPDILDFINQIEIKLLNVSSTLSPEEAYLRENENSYLNNEKDEREITLRAIKLRRGQQDFRDKLLKRYNNTCIVTGCKITAILEAAHINPYRGEKDNHPENGLLLRADIHTLFDLNLIGVDPHTLTITVSNTLLNTEYEIFKNKKIIIGKETPSKNALFSRWNLSHH